MEVELLNIKRGRKLKEVKDMTEIKKLKNIKDGVVIDHIREGCGLTILAILGIKRETKEKISVITNVKSNKIGLKDMVKLENVKINPSQLNIIAIVAPNATISTIKDYKVANKYKVTLPSEIKGVFECLNPSCASLYNPVSSKFLLTERSKKIVFERGNQGESLRVKCYFCEREWKINKLIESMEIIKSKETFEFVKNRMEIKKGSF